MWRGVGIVANSRLSAGILRVARQALILYVHIFCMFINCEQRRGLKDASR